MKYLWNFFKRYTYCCSCSNNYFSNKKINDNKKIGKIEVDDELKEKLNKLVK